eukprot:2049144-Amphidinium_carterae.1
MVVSLLPGECNAGLPTICSNAPTRCCCRQHAPRAAKPGVLENRLLSKVFIVAVFLKHVPQGVFPVLHHIEPELETNAQEASVYEAELRAVLFVLLHTWDVSIGTDNAAVMMGWHQGPYGKVTQVGKFASVWSSIWSLVEGRQ